MIISHRHKFLYFVIPKAASATVRMSLAPFVDIGWPVSKYQQHMTIRKFVESEFQSLFNEYKKFTFVRNPYDRIYSGYLQDRFAAKNYPRWARAKEPIFDLIGDDFSRYFNEFVIPADIVNRWEWICFCPMAEFACNNDSLAMDFIGRAEHLSEDLAKLSVFLEVPLVKAGDENVRQGLCSEDPKYLDHFDRRTVEAVNELYARDFALFGFKKLDPCHFPIVSGKAGCDE